MPSRLAQSDATGVRRGSHSAIAMPTAMESRASSGDRHQFTHRSLKGACMATEVMAPPIEGMLDEATIEEFRGRLRGPLLTPDDPELRRGPRRPQRSDRPPPGADRALLRHRRRRRVRQLRAGAWSPALRAGRRSQRRRQRRQRRRAGHRPLADARRLRRSGCADGPRAGRGNLGRRRPRDAALWPGGSGRRRLQHGNRRADHPRWVRSPATEVRSEPRQPDLRRDRDRRRPGADGQRNRERRPLLGRARGRQQLRGDHQLRVSPASGRSDRAVVRALLRAGGRAGR